MKQITPLVGISRIISSYNVLICGFDGVITKGKEIFPEALDALKKAHENGVSIFLLTNSALRVSKLLKVFLRSDFDLSIFSAVITMGEILHYKLKYNKDHLQRYYNIGSVESEDLFEGLNYQKVENLNNADFIFAGALHHSKSSIEDYMSELEHAYTLHVPLISVGTDTSCYINGEVRLAAGALAEQYAVLGGEIRTINKSDKEIIRYMQESLQKNDVRILYIGDSLTSDLKSANLLGADMVLVSKGIHVHSLGEGYIPDISKARDLALNFDGCPDYVISELRW